MQTTGRILLLLAIFLVSGCVHLPTYRTVTDDEPARIYRVTGRVRNTFERPVANCQVYLTRTWPSANPNILSRQENIPVATTDVDGDYSFVFERQGATVFHLYFDARESGYKDRYLDITPLLTSRLFQYSGNNPVIANVILLPENTRPTGDSPQPEEHTEQ